jgi:hypothetical protein
MCHNTTGRRLVDWVFTKSNLSLYPSQSRWGFMQFLTTAIMGCWAIAISFVAIWITTFGRADMTWLWWLSLGLSIVFFVISVVCIVVFFITLSYFRADPNTKSSDEYLKEISEAVKSKYSPKGFNIEFGRLKIGIRLDDREQD